MKMQEITAMAKSLGLSPGRRNKIELIRLIQEREGNFSCFGTATAGECDQQNCLWRGDCLRRSVKH